MLAKDAKYDFAKGSDILAATQAELAELGEEKDGEGDETKGERIYLGTIIDNIVGDFETFSGRMSLVMPGPCPRQPLESSNFADEKNKFEDEAKRYSHDFNIGAAKANAICESAAKDYEDLAKSDGFEKAGDVARAIKSELAIESEKIDEFVDKHGHDQKTILESKTTCGEYLDYQKSVVKYHELTMALRDIGDDFRDSSRTEVGEDGAIPRRTLSASFYKAEKNALAKDAASNERMADAELGEGWKGKAMLEGDMDRIEVMARAVGRLDADATVEKAASAYETKHGSEEKPFDFYESDDKSEL